MCENFCERKTMKTFEQFIGHAFTQFLTIGPVDVIDIALVAVIIFFVIKFISDKRAGKLAIGICMILFLLVISQIFQMSATNFLFSNIAQFGVILLVVVFQSEIRSALEKIGGAGKELKILPGNKDGKGNRRFGAISTLCEAVQELARDYTGALIVIERDTPQHSIPFVVFPLAVTVLWKVKMRIRKIPVLFKRQHGGNG